MKTLAGRKRHSAEDIVRKLRRADELAAKGKTGEEVAAELGVSAATLYNWRRAYGVMDTDAAKELKELREQNGQLKRLLAEAELEKDALREVGQGKILSPAAKRRAVDMRKDTLSKSERLACKAVGLTRSAYRRLLLAGTPADPDAQLRAWLRAYATKHPCHEFRRAWAALRYDERRAINKKKVHRLWREEGLQVWVHSPRKRAGVSSIPPVDADAPNVVWAIDFQFDSIFCIRSGRPLSRDAIEHLVTKHAVTAARTTPTLVTKHVSPHTLRHSAAMALLHAGVDLSVIALWLGHESTHTVQAYLHADMALKERALALSKPADSAPGHYRPPDSLLAFLTSL